MGGTEWGERREKEKKKREERNKRREGSSWVLGEGEREEREKRDTLCRRGEMRQSLGLGLFHDWRERERGK